MILTLNTFEWRGTWVAQPVERPTSAQVMISVRELEPCIDSTELLGILSLSAPPPLALYISQYKLKKIFK